MDWVKEYKEAFSESINEQVIYDLEHLPPFLKHDMSARDEYDVEKHGLIIDCLLGELRSSINIADVEGMIAPDTARYLRWKYFGIPIEGY